MIVKAKNPMPIAKRKVPTMDNKKISGSEQLVPVRTEHVSNRLNMEAVSYTHLTLPTILRV